MLPRVAYVTHAGAIDPDLNPALVAFEQAGLQGVPVTWDSAQDWADFDLVLVRTCGQGGQRREFLRWARDVEQRALLANPAVTLARNTDRTYLRDLRGQGIATIDTVWFEPGDSLDVCERTLSETQWPQFVVASNFGTHNDLSVTSHTPADAAQVAAEIAAQGNVGLIQPLLEVRSAVSIVVIDNAISHAVDQTRPTSHGVIDIDEDLESMVDEVVVAAAQGEQLLYSRLDVVSHGQGWRVSGFEATGPRLFFDAVPAAASSLAWAIRDRITEDVRAVGSRVGSD